MSKLLKNTVLIAITLASAVSSSAYAEHVHDRPDSHAPVGVMGDHLMEKGEWMASYRFMNMKMDGMRSGTSDLSPDQVAALPNALGGESMRMGFLPDGTPRIMTVPSDYRIAPLEMDMDMHMFGLMYGVSHDITAMVMINYIEKEMLLRTYMGPTGTNVVGDFTGKTSGLGDTTVSALFRLTDEGDHNFHLNLGLSLPTGSITESGSVLPPFSGMMGTVPGERVSIDRLAYPMQLGSGTVDFMPGFTYTARSNDVSWGAQMMATLRFYDNKENYRLGNVYEGSAWLARQWASWVSTSARIAAKSEGSIKGRDLVITGGNPLSDPANSGRDVVNLFLGVNLLGTSGWMANHRLSFEIGTPVYEKVDGVQMSQDMTVSLGWRTTF